MADSNITGVLSSADQIKANYEQYKDKFVDKDKELISQQTFLKLLVAEMSNQDPLEPTSNTEFISQLAQFSSMQYMQDSSKYAMANYASSLVGKVVSASRMEGTDLVIKTGVVEKVVYRNNSYVLTINGEEFDLSKVTSIITDGTSSGSSGAQTADSLADRIARASQMVGMYAWVKTGETDLAGNELFVQGFIESIIVKDGEIKIVIGGEAYSMEDIDELTYATVVDGSQNPESPEDPESPDKVEDPEDPDNVEDVEPTEPSETEKSEGTEGPADTDQTENEAGNAEETEETYNGIGASLNAFFDMPVPEPGSDEEKAYVEQLQEIISSMM